MIKLEDLKPNAAIRGLLPDSQVSIINIQWYGSEAIELTYKSPDGKVANELLYRSDESRLDLVTEGRPWSFDGDGAKFRLVSEAHRIRLAHLFDPVLAVFCTGAAAGTAAARRHVSDLHQEMNDQKMHEFCTVTSFIL